MRSALFGLALVAVAASAAFAVDDKDKKPAVREFKDPPALKPTDVKKPTVLASAEDGEKLLGKEGAANLQKEVDFANEQLLIFSWAGSGGDKLAAASTTDKDEVTVVFTYTRGLTKDLRMHVKAWVIPKKAKWKFADDK